MSSSGTTRVDGSPDAGAITVAVVMPAFNAATLLPASLPPLLATAPGGEVLVVDPGSTDATAAVAESLGARVLRLGARAGPAAARNAGASAVTADVVLFVDSDCIAHLDVVDRVRAAFSADPKLVTLTGSYDDAPPDPGFFSQYMNLRHHHTHQGARRENATFWAGCGAVRLAAFRRTGGFDADRFPRPMIEDIELGVRLSELGRCRLDPDLQVKHLKRWTLRSVVTTDITCRAIPWSQLILERQGLPDDLNLRSAQRVAAAVAPLALAGVISLPVLVALVPWWSLIALGVIAVSWLLNRDLIRLFWHRRGLRFALCGWLFHQVHLFYSAAIFAALWLRHRLRS